MTTSAETPVPASGSDRPGDALVLDGVCVAYGRNLALSGITGRLARGGALALIGPNGAGKSTLIRSIMGLVPLHAGAIEVLGHDPVAARQQVAYVPQADQFDLEFPITVEQVVLTGRYRQVGWFRRPGRDDRELAAHALERVGLTHRAKARFGTLSGGQRQRVLLARAIAQGAQLLLLDEPFNGVDTTTTDVLLEVLSDLRRDGAAVVLSTHDLSVAHLACGDACLINRHQIAFGPIDGALTSELLQQTYGHSAVVLAGDSTIVTTR